MQELHSISLRLLFMYNGVRICRIRETNTRHFVPFYGLAKLLTKVDGYVFQKKESNERQFKRKYKFY